jgi:predicted transcriptional regulator
MPAKKTENAERLRRNEEKWTPTLMAAGWTVLPSIILEKQHALGLDAVDVNILLQLARHWWYKDNPPYPSKSTIALCIGVDPSTVRRHIARMETAGFIKRQSRFDSKYGGQQTNIYHFTGLIKEATPFAQESLRTREQRHNEDMARRNRKKPKPLVDKAGASALAGKGDK